MQIPSNYKFILYSSFFLIFFINIVNSAILVPPYFNLVVNRKIHATATCGVFDKEDGISTETRPEEYCILTGATVNDFASGVRGQVKQGQFCDICNASDPAKSHEITNAIDGTHRWWQSPPLSRSLDYNEVNITIDLNQEFHVAYIYITMGNSPRPATWVLEKSSDYGKTYKPWQYFAEHSNECSSLFSTNANKQIESDEEVLCTTSFSKAIPLEGGEMLISLVNNRPSSKNFSNSDSLQEWTRATNIRLRLLRTKSLLGHLMALSRQDPSVTRRYFYSIRDISVGGRCVCNGHANDCETEDPETNKQVCSCEHNTCGDQCQECCPGFVQKKWRPNREYNEYRCEPCQCHGHSFNCHYDEDIDSLKKSLDIYGNYEGGGVCDDCQHNTEGVNCEKCVDGFYLPTGVNITDEDACKECECDLNISTGRCTEGTGICECKENFAGVGCTQCAVGFTNYPLCEPCKCNVHGRSDNLCVEEHCNCKLGYAQPYCDSCDDTFYAFPNCTECDCDLKGIIDGICDKTSGQCKCRVGYRGKRCDECEDGFYEDGGEYSACDCSDKGVTSEICNKKDGKCICKPNFAGEQCDQCAPGHYNYPICDPCECNLSGSQNENCTFYGGIKQCLCKVGRGGPDCDQCAPGYFQFPDCLPCECNEAGSTGLSCDLKMGKCRCKTNFVGEKCDECAANLFNFPICEECSCNPIGVMPQFAGCDKKLRNVTSICPCKEHVTGRHCDKCKDEFYGLGSDTENGCTPCNCLEKGSLNGLNTCDSQTGKCICKHFVGKKSCTECEKGSYSLKNDNILGCEPCECRIGSSLNNHCDTETGTCSCLQNIIGDKCDQPDNGYYIDDLHSLKYELEDGYTLTRNSVRYEFDSDAFPNFSWKGYVKFKEIENQVSQDIFVEKPGSYRMILRYMSKNSDLEELTITVKEQNTDDVELTQMHLQSSFKPEFATVTRNQVNAVTFELERAGVYSVTFKTKSDNIYIDYFVLLPSDYYEPSLLKKNAEKICQTKATEPCILNTYLQVDSFTSKILANDPKFESQKESLNKYTDNKNSFEVVPIDENLDLTFELKFPRPQSYILIVEYFNENDATDLRVNVEPESKTHSQNGHVTVYKCKFDSLCRQIILSNDSREPLIVNAFQKAEITLRTAPDGKFHIYRIISIPKERFDLNYVKMAPKCIMKDNLCLPIEYTSMPDLIREEIATGSEEERSDLSTNILNGKTLEIHNVNTKLVYLNDYYKGIQFPLVKTGHKVGSNQGGGYVMLIHYFQPNYPVVNVSVNIDDTYKGSFKASFCPSTSGCRAIVAFENSEIFDYDKSRLVSIQLASNDRDIWLNYALVGPSTAVTPDLMKTAPIDLISEFITKCASQHFNIEFGKNDFCDQAVFSLSSKYNNGAKPCECNQEGSITSDNCEIFGGQCECKSNVVGRQCTKCKPGYYGFPDCRKCNCPGRNCDDKTGKCSCPANVIQNDDCNTCIPGYYGFHPEHGCVACDCSKNGSLSSNLNLCDVKTGQCQCKENIGGLNCEKCKPGFYGYPYCSQCACNVNGTTETICDSYGHCSCKDNLHDPFCEACVDGTFNLESRNPKGCTKCFCFGHTQRCDSSSYHFFYSFEDMNANTWKSNKMNGVEIVALESGRLQLTIDKESVDKPNEPIYWIAPSTYLGKKLHSYGGAIRYKLLFRTSDSKTQSFTSPEVILEGEGMTIAYRSLKQPTNGDIFTNTIDLLESQFTHLSSGAAVTREQLMIVLRNLSNLQILAGSNTQSVSSAELISVEIDLAKRRDDDMDSEQSKDELRPARSVERCECPQTYFGLSCESCQPGYYKLKGSKAGSFTCIPCNCNGHADSCDEESGECMNCMDNTEGKNCEKCKSGYYNNGYGCERCPCPGPVKNFAHNCSALADNTVQCNCQVGYTGLFCSSCAAGYYGSPHLPIESDEGKCLQCKCNGNIDMNDIRSCDQKSGKCLKCLKNTTGDNCERCKDWHWGDPIEAKSCTECQCDKCGSESCDIASGTCTCKANVKGMNCNSCAENTWGFNSCNGCKECRCDPIGSRSQQCDTFSGNCFCKEGVTGKYCDMCEADYWNFGANGCQPCNCEKHGVQTGMSGIACNNNTGDCRCIPGVKGKYCDQCDDRWILVKHKGCMECDTCVHTLLDDADELQKIAEGIENRNSSLAVKAYSRLTELEVQYNDLKELSTQTNLNEIPLLQIQKRIKIISSESIPDLLFVSIDFDESMRNYNSTYQDALVFNQNISSLRMNMDEITLLMNTLEMLKKKAEASAEDNLDALQASVDDILSQSFNETTRALNNAIDSVAKDKKNADDVISNYEKKIKQLEDINGKTSQIENSIIELKGIIDMAKSVEKFKEKDVTFIAYIENFDKLRDESVSIQENTSSTYDSAKNLLQNLKEGLKDANNGLSDLETAVNSLDNLQVNHNSKVQELQEKLKEARAKSESLLKISNEWETRINRSQAGLEAFEIANIYDTIAKILNTAYNKSKEVLENYEKASERLDTYLSEFEKYGKRREEYLRKFNELEKDHASFDLTTASLIKNHADLSQTLLVLNNEITNIEIWVNKTQKNENVLNDIENTLNSQENELKKHSAKSIELKTTIQTIESLKNKGNEDGNLETVNNVKKLNDLINNVQELNNNVSRRVSSVSNGYRLLDEKLQDVNGIIDEIKLLIESTRTIANEIKVAVKFKNTSYIKLRNAPVFMPSMSTIGSLYLNTTDSNAPISVIYNKKEPNAYMALYLKNGRAHMQYRLSENSKTNIISTGLEINNGQWYKLEAERIGRIARLKVLNDRNSVLANESSETDDSNVVFNIDSMNANFYLGQFKFPDEVPVGLQSLVNDGLFKNQFEGGIDSVTMNRHSFGLWNYEDSNDIEGEIKRSRAETEPSLVNSKLPVHFNENSFLCSDKTLTRSQRNLRKFDITFKFKTTNPNGILWYGKDNTNFKINVIIYLEDGRVAVDLLSTSTRITLDSRNNDKWNSERKFTDNKFHVIQVVINFDIETVRISVFEKEVVDLVNGELGLSRIQQPTNKLSFAATHVCVGGIPNSYKEQNELSKSSFIGCFEYYFSKNIENDRIYLQQELLKATTTSSGIDTKCPDVIDQCSFQQSSSPVYVSFKEGIDSIEDVASFGISFIPKFPNGTLLFIRQKELQDNEAVNYIHLYVENLYVYLVVKNTDKSNALKLESKTKVIYNGLNHVYVHKNGKEFTLTINDALASQQLPEKIRLFTNSELFVGGVPVSQRTGISHKFNNFQGCVVDLFYKNKPLKFHNSMNTSRGLNFLKCYTPQFESFAMKSDKPLVKLHADKSNKKAQVKDESCSLSKEYDQSVTKPVGIRFGLTRHSHMQVLDDNKLNSLISLKFRTVLAEGLIFYATDLRFEKYISIWLKDGYLNYAYNTDGTSLTHIISKKQYNDGRYHTLMATRSSFEGTLKILDKTNSTVLEIIQEKSTGDDKSLNLIGPYYIGGLSESIFNGIPESHKNVISIETFVGCMSEFVIGNKKVELLKNRVKRIETMNCSNTHESGIFFTGTNQATHASFKSQISMKDAFELEMDIKPRTKNGVILYIGPEDSKSNKDFATLELVNGELVYQIYFGGITNLVKYTPKESNNELCNSNWIRIKIKKSGNGKILLNVKNEEFISNKGDLLPSSAKNNVLYLGGLPYLDLYTKSTVTKEPFVGCIRDLVINQGIMKNHKILLDLKLEEGVLNYCPLK